METKTSELSTFFKESSSALGVFYPMHYIIASFPDDQSAKNAVESLRHIGIPEDEAMAATADQMAAYLRDFKEEAGLLGGLMRPLSRFIDTEATFADKNAAQARAGLGFAAIHCLDEAQSVRILEALHAHTPGSAVWYLPGGVRSLI